MAGVSGTHDARGGRALQQQTLDQADGRLYGAEQVADRLGCGVAAVTRLARDGELPGAFKVGSMWRFPAAPFEAMVRDWWQPTDDGPSFEDWAAQLADNDQQPTVAEP